MRRIALLILSIFLFTTPIFGQVAAIKGASAVTQIPAGGLEMVYELTFAHTAADFAVLSSTFTAPIDISFRPYLTCLVEIYSATMQSGLIGGASFEVCITAREDIVSPSEVTAPWITQWAEVADTTIWKQITAINNYGRYGFALVGGTRLYLRANGIDRVQRKARITIR